jgi:FkbM family methyltransferase
VSLITTRYGEFNIIDTDSVISGSLRLYGEWAQHEIDLLAYFIRPGSVVVDAGAFIGTHTRAFSALVGATGKVLAFEPRQVAFAILFENAKLAPDNNICVINSALGATQNSVMVQNQRIDTKVNYGASKLEALKNQEDAGEKVTIATLDVYTLERLDFLKIDVEGMELDVLKGSKETIKRCRPIIFAECNSLEASAPIIEWCREENYQICGVLSPAYNQHNYAGNTKNIYGAAQETGMLLIPFELFPLYEEVIFKQNLPQIKIIDDLVLLMLHKPQYPSEVLACSAAAANLSLAYTSPQANMLNQAVVERDRQITNLNQAVAERDRQITNLNQAVAERDRQITNLNQAVAEGDGRILSIIQNNREERNKIIREFQTSFSWKLTKPVRFVATVIRSSRLILATGNKKIAAASPSINRANFTKAVQLIKAGRYRELAFRSYSLIKGETIKYPKYKPAQDPWWFLWSVECRSILHPIKNKFPVDIVIPVYNGYKYLAPLFESLKKNTAKGTYRLIVIDDCSSDNRVQAELLKQKNCFDQFELIKNDCNLGFIGAVNRAVENVTSDVFVLLNTDTEVPKDWLDRLIEPMLADKTIASATPFSNSATICSFPNFMQDNELYLGLSASQIDDAFRSLPTTSREISIPTGVGFCMAVSRCAVKRLGLFDPVYGRGYCEENDWCMRTASFGYRHLLVQNLFVYHKHGGSFPSAEKEALIVKNDQLLLSRYPIYQQLVSDFIKLDPAKTIKQFVKLKLSCIASESGAVLIIDHGLGAGGSKSYRSELAHKYLEAKTPVIVLVDDARTNSIQITASLNDEEFIIRIPNLTKLEEIFTQLKIGHVIYNNAVASSKPQLLIQTITKLRERHAFELTALFHDFYPICPSYTLLNKDGVYCGVPEDINICSQCISKVPFSYSASIPRDTIMTEWRKCWAAFLKVSDNVVCFSANSKSIILKAYPFLQDTIRVVPHIINATNLRKPCIRYEQPMHIGIVGGINYAKGLSVVLGLVEVLKNKNDKVTKVTVIGEVDAVTPIEGLTVTGRYQKNWNKCFFVFERLL